jgi:hypothetical protein
MPLPPPLAADRRRPAIAVAVAVAAVAYAVAGSFTHPFTRAADALTAVPLAVAVVVVAARMRGAGPADVIRSDHQRKPSTGLTRWSHLWAVIAAVVVSWELYCYASTPRSEHPTLSTLIDLLDSTRIGKIAAFALWLALGWYLVWR